MSGRLKGAAVASGRRLAAGPEDGALAADEGRLLGLADGAVRAAVAVADAARHVRFERYLYFDAVWRGQARGQLDQAVRAADEYLLHAAEAQERQQVLGDPRRVARALSVGDGEHLRPQRGEQVEADEGVGPPRADDSVDARAPRRRGLGRRGQRADADAAADDEQAVERVGQPKGLPHRADQLG